jgi:tetratricopeptide (TPR) repeat protein
MKWILQIVLFYSFSLVSNSALGQSNKIDSLKARLELHPQEDSIHLDLILKLSEAHVYFNRDTMLNYAIRGKKLAMELNSPAQFLYALQREGAFYYAKFALDTALEIFSLGYRMSVAENILERQSAFLGSIGITRFQQGLTDTALHYLKMAFETDQRLGDSVKMMVRLNNIGAVYHAIDDPANSLRYLYQSLKIAEALNIPEKVALTANNIAVLYQRYDNKEKALLFFKLSLKNMEGESIARTALLVNIGDLYLQMEVMYTAL